MPNLAQHSKYCSQHNTYCSGMLTGNEADRSNKYARSNSGQGYHFSTPFNARADPNGTLTADNLDVDTSDDILYHVSITMGGQNFTVLLDTGSSDLWLHTAGRTMVLTNTTDLSVTSETYGHRRVRVDGKIKFADLQIGAYTITQQAFLHVTEANVHGFNLTNYDGILGIAFDVGSIYGKVQAELGTEAADEYALSPMTALFAQNASLPNNFDVQLSRPVNGTIFISDHAAQYENVKFAPKLRRVSPEHWSLVMDAMLINGQRFSFNPSQIAGVPAGTVVAALDTGFSFPSLPQAAIDMIYRSVPGAKYDNNTQVWLVPCDRSPNLTFVFGGQPFPVHPLDLTFPTTSTLRINNRWDTKNVTECINTFQYLPTEPTSSDGFDIILADAFLHNVYTSFNYGDWNPTTNPEGTPYVQMISTTNSSTMWEEFYTDRNATLAQLPPSLDPASIVQYDTGSIPTKPARPVATPSTTATQAPDSLAANLSGAVSADEAPGSADNDSWGNKYAKVVLALLAANLAVGVALLVAVLTMCARRRKEMSASRSTRYAPVRFKEPVEDYGRSSVMSSR